MFVCRRKGGGGKKERERHLLGPTARLGFRPRRNEENGGLLPRGHSPYSTLLFYFLCVFLITYVRRPTSPFVPCYDPWVTMIGASLPAVAVYSSGGLSSFIFCSVLQVLFIFCYFFSSLRYGIAGFKYFCLFRLSAAKSCFLLYLELLLFSSFAVAMDERLVYL